MLKRNKKAKKQTKPVEPEKTPEELEAEAEILKKQMQEEAEEQAYEKVLQEKEAAGEDVMYKLKMVYDKEDIGAMVRTLMFRRQPNRNLRLALRIGYPLFGIIMMIGSVYTAMNMANQESIKITGEILGWVLVVVCFVAGVILIRRSSTKGMERRSWKQYQNKGLELTYTFYHDRFVEEDEVSGTNEYRYLSVKNGNEDKTHYYLFNTNNSAHMLKKDSFLIGDPDSFPLFIRIKAAVRLDNVDDTFD